MPFENEILNRLILGFYYKNYFNSTCLYYSLYLQMYYSMKLENQRTFFIFKFEPSPLQWTLSKITSKIQIKFAFLNKHNKTY